MGRDNVVVMKHDYPRPNPDGWLSLRYFHPPVDLATHFGPAYIFTATQDEVVDFTRADFAQLRFMLAGEGDYVFSSGKTMRTPRICLLGPTLGATNFNVTGPVQLIGVNVMPLGWLSLIDTDASAHADSLLDMATSGDAGYAALLETLHGIEDPEAAVAELWRFLRARIRPTSQAIHRFVLQTNNWLLEDKVLTVEGLAARTTLSPRQISRLTNRLFGCSPKYLARKYRALRYTWHIGMDEADWRDLVGEAFYDQSHLIRELKHFIGMTPHQIRNHPTLLARLQFTRREFEKAMAPYSAYLPEN